MDACIECFPATCRDNLRAITKEVRTDVDTAYNMMLMTATLMDLRPEDPRVAEIILDDCKGRRVMCSE